MSDNNKLLTQLKATYMGASGDALIAYFESQAAGSLRRLTSSTDHIDMVKAQTEYNVFMALIKLKETVRTFK